MEPPPRSSGSSPSKQGIEAGESLSPDSGRDPEARSEEALQVPTSFLSLELPGGRRSEYDAQGAVDLDPEARRDDSRGGVIGE